MNGTVSGEPTAAAPVPVRDRGIREAPSVALLTTTVPGYRQLAIDAVDARLSGMVKVFAGREYFDPTIRLGACHSGLTVVGNHFLARRRLLWQAGAFKSVVRADIAILELNPRVLTTWIILVSRRVLGRRSILWGHSWPRGGPDARSDFVRHMMRRLATAVVVYSETQGRELRRRMPNSLVVAAPNALYPLAWAGAAADPGTPTDFVFVGRLIDAKKPDLLLDAFVAALERLPRATRLVFVGDGPLRAELIARSTDLPPDRIRFMGEITDFDGLRRVYGTALASVSPGYVGLSLTQSLWFGVPAIIARDEPHSPEIEAARKDFNSVFFESDSVDALSDALVRVENDRDAWLARRPEIARDCATRYSVESMIDPIVKLVEALRP